MDYGTAALLAGAGAEWLGRMERKKEKEDPGTLGACLVPWTDWQLCDEIYTRLYGNTGLKIQRWHTRKRIAPQVGWDG